jgi:hypothetical protein
MRIRLLFSLIVAVLALPAAAQIDTVTGEKTPPPLSAPPQALTLVRTEMTRELVSGSAATVFPDGRSLAYLDEGLNSVCTVELLPVGGGSAPVCSAPADPQYVRADGLTISPDGRYAVFHDNSALYLYDADLLLYDRERGIIRNLTDDGYVGGLLGGSAVPAELPVDYTPVWSHDSRTIYFVRTLFRADGMDETGIYRIAVDGGAPEPVAPIAVGRDSFYTIYAGQAAQLGGALSLSPGGRSLAMVQNFFQRGEAVVSVIEIETGAITEIARLASLARWLGGADAPQSVMLTGVDWLADESGLLIALMDADIRPERAPWASVVQFTFADETIAPLVDLTAQDLSGGAAEDSPLLLQPMAVGLLPDRSAVVWAGQFGGVLRLWWSPLPIGAPYTPQALPPAAGTAQGSVRAVPTSLGGDANSVRALFGGLLFTLLREN